MMPPMSSPEYDYSSPKNLFGAAGMMFPQKYPMGNPNMT
jgi:hypothetical protein